MKSGCKIAQNQWLTKHNDHYVHDNHKVIGIICCCFACFMFIANTFMEQGECRRSVSLDLIGELARLFVLVFALHEDWWKFGSNWHIELWKDEESWT